jgi:hypothetical protein
MGERGVSNYSEDREWGDLLLPVAKQILGPLLLCPADDVRDQNQATDLIVLAARDMRIGVRIRRPGFADRYGNEFTLRSHRTTGTRTEFSKIVDGWGDWLFYGHAVSSEKVSPWVVVDLHAFRAMLCRVPWQEGARRGWWGEKWNLDGKTKFSWFNLRKIGRMDPPLSVASRGIAALEEAA